MKNCLTCGGVVENSVTVCPDCGMEFEVEKDPFDSFSFPSAVAPVEIKASIRLKRSGQSTDEVFSFGSGAIVGRFDANSGPVDVDLAPLPEATYVSRHHVEFLYNTQTESWSVKDLGSRNGTFWRPGGQGAFSRVTEQQPLQSGDEIALGNARFEFKAN